jgi:cobalt-zinc-cadmium resistance protein CzcA
MLSAIVSWALRNRPTVLLGTLLLLIVGLRAASQLPIDAVPDITNIQVQVITTAPALAPVEVERYVTIPIERAMAAVPRSTEIRSISKYGLSVVTIVFREDTNIYFARQVVAERMRDVAETVRHGTPSMGPISTGLGEIYQYVVRNPKLSTMELEELQHWEIGPRLRSVPGIVEVNDFGGEERQYQIVVDPARLKAADISIDRVVAAVTDANANAGGGYLEHNREHFVIGTDGMAKSIDDLRRAVVDVRDGVPITVGSIGEVRIAPRLRLGAASRDAQGEVVVGVTLMLMGENARTVTEAVKAKVASIIPALPEGTTIEPFYDRSVLVGRTTATVARNLAEGAILVIVVLLLLLGDVRAGLVVASTIPLAMLFAILAMTALDLSGNLMSLGAIDFGLIVDGGVIIVENAIRRIDLRQRDLGRALTEPERTIVVRDATVEVQSASVFGVFILAIVYLPILALSGIEGKMFRPMATTVLLALAGALFLSLTFVPVAASLALRRKVSSSEASHDTFILRKAHAAFVPLLSRAMRHPRVTIVGAVIALVVSVLMFTRIGAEFIPQLDEGDMLVEVRRVPGVALTESVAIDKRLQAAVLSVPEVLHAVSKTGAPSIATDPMGMEQTDVYLAMRPRSEWRPGVDRDAVAQQLVDVIAARVPEVAVAISQPIQMRSNELIAGVRSDVAVMLYGPDLDKLLSMGEHVAALARQVPGAVDVRVEQVAGLRYLRVIPDRAELARRGLTINDVNLVVETIAVGHQVGEIFEGERRHSIVVKTAHGYQGDLDPLRALPLRSSDGKIVPLGEVATLAYLPGPAQIGREAQSRRLIVEFNVRGRDLLSVVDDTRAAIARTITIPTGYRVEWGGQFEHYTEARARLSIVVPLSLALIVFFLWRAVGSFKRALVIFLGVPFAAAGGVLALFLRGIPFSISAGVGFIALFGVAVLNGLVLVSFAEHLEAEGVPPDVAIHQAAEVRLRPVLTTALVAALGFVPMAISTAPGAEVQRPLATVVIGGLVTATALTLLVLPVVQALVTRRKAPVDAT